MIPGIVAGAWRDRDPYWSSVVLAMHMDGADNGTTFTDIKGKTISVFGDTKTKTSTKKFGTASAYFDGTGDYLTLADSADWDFGTGNFTVECWFNANSISSSTQVILNRQDATSTNMALQLRISNTNKIEAVVRSAGSGTAYTFTGTTTLSSGTFYYTSISRVSGVFYLHLNGSQEATLTQTITLDGTAGIYIGSLYDGGVSFAGYVDDLRITKGIGRYSGGYSAPTKEFPSSG